MQSLNSVTHCINTQTQNARACLLIFQFKSLLLDSLFTCFVHERTHQHHSVAFVLEFVTPIKCICPQLFIVLLILVSMRFWITISKPTNILSSAPKCLPCFTGVNCFIWKWKFLGGKKKRRHALAIITIIKK